MLFSPACERNKGPILAVLEEWLPARAQVLEIGSGSGQHAAFFCQQIAGLTWQTSERQENLTDLQAQLEALSPTLPAAIALDVTDTGQWPRQSFDAVFSANTAHIMSAAAVTHLLAGASRVLRPSGRLGLLWNVRDERLGWVKDFGRIVGLEHDWADATVELPEPFTDMTTHQVEWTNYVTPQTLVDYVASRSYCITSPAEVRSRTLDEVRTLLATHPALANSTGIAMPYITVCVRAMLG
jgi:SAM-dependent methyltransferase